MRLSLNLNTLKRAAPQRHRLDDLILALISLALEKQGSLLGWKHVFLGQTNFVFVVVACYVSLCVMSMSFPVVAS